MMYVLDQGRKTLSKIISLLILPGVTWSKTYPTPYMETKVDFYGIANYFLGSSKDGVFKTALILKTEDVIQTQSSTVLGDSLEGTICSYPSKEQIRSCC